MVNLKILRKRIAITVGVLLVAEFLTAAPAFATSEDLTITKVAPSATSSDSFPFTVTKAPGSNNPNIYPNGTPSVAFNLDSSNSFTKTFSGFQNASTGVVTSPNNYTITESTPAGWNAPTISCQDTNPNSNAFSNITFNYSSPSVSFQYTPNAMVPGAHIKCTFTNTRMTAVTLSTTVSAVTIPAGSLGHDSATLTNATGGSLTYNLFAGTCPAQAMNVPIFTSAVSVGNTGVVPDSLSYTFANAGSYYWVAVYTPASGSPIVTGPCEPLTVTPNAKTTLTVTKIIVPSSGNTDTFTLEVFDANGLLLANFLNAGNTGTLGPITLTPGNYSVGETGANLSQYTATYSADCFPAGAVTLASGDNKICTITNTKKVKPTATLTVIKRLLPGTGNPNKFNLIIGPTGFLGSGTTPNVGNAGTTGAVTISSWVNYNVSESAGIGGTNLSNYTTVFSGVCAPAGVVNLAANTSGICIITNTKKARLRVIKKLIPAGDPGRFNLKINSSTVAFNKGNNGSSGFVSVPAGAGNSVGETAANSITVLSNYTRTYSPGCAPTFVLAPGATKTCIITNKRKHK
jgi:hypothetical protein